MGNVWKKILDSAPITYFYCKVLKNCDGIDVDLLIEETNYSNKSILNKKVSELLKLDIMCLPYVDMSFCKHIVEVLDEYGEFNTDGISIKRVNNDYIVLWLTGETIDKNLSVVEELNNQKKLLELFIDAMDDYVFYKDINGVYLSCNKKSANYIGKSKKDVIGRTDFDLFDEDRAKQFRERDREVITGKKKKVYIEEKILSNGKRFIEETVKSPYFDRNNNVLGVVGVSKDISYKVAVEESVMNNELVLFNILNHLEDVIIIKDNEKTIFVNHAFEKLYGINRGEVYKRDSLEITKEMLHEEDKILLDNINDDEPLDRVVRLIRKDNDLRWIWVRSYPLKDQNNEVIRKITVINDITHRKYVESELDKLRRDFFANISHEFKTPINLIYTSLQFINFKIDNSDIAEKEQYKMCIDSCNKNVFRMIKLINNMIDSIKISEGMFRYNPRNLEIVSLVEDIVSKTNEFFKDTSIEIVFDTEFEERLAFFDKEHIERVILNILSNSIKFNDKNGKIYVDLLLDEEMISIRVRDTGIGIPINKLDDIFDRMKNINNRMTKVNEGCGIGLYITNKLIELHEGDIKIKSVLGVGTEISIRIPDIVDNKELSNCNLNSMNYVEYLQLDKFKVEFSDIYLN